MTPLDDEFTLIISYLQICRASLVTAVDQLPFSSRIGSIHENNIVCSDSVAQNEILA